MKSILAIFLIVCALGAEAADSFYLKEGDRVVFYGDSITDQRLYTTYTETFVVTRFPELNVNFVHSGWGGDRVSGGGGGPIALRLERDVLAYKPTVMTIMLGMNDASYRAFDQNVFHPYTNGYQAIVSRMKKEVPGIRMTLIQPSPFDDVTRPANFEGGYNAVLVRYGEYIKDLAQREQLHVADLNTSVVEATRKAHAENAQLAIELNKDRVHPGQGGQLLMAAALLKAWKAPSLVSHVEINGTKAQPKNATVSDLKAANGGFTWKQKDKALPFPINMDDAVVALAVRSSDILDSLNQQTVKIAGLKEGTYALKIDGAEVGAFSAADFQKGVNMAVLKTPMSKQAAEVHRLTLEHNNVHFQRWRQVQVPFAADKDEGVAKGARALMAALDEKENQIVKQQRAAAQPKEHAFEVVPK